MHRTNLYTNNSIHFHKTDSTTYYILTFLWSFNRGQIWQEGGGQKVLVRKTNAMKFYSPCSNFMNFRMYLTIHMSLSQRGGGDGARGNPLPKLIKTTISILLSISKTIKKLSCVPNYRGREEASKQAQMPHFHTSHKLGTEIVSQIDLSNPVPCDVILLAWLWDYS